VNYVLNGVDHNVYERHADASWSEINVNGGGMQIAGSVNDIVYILKDPLGNDGGYGPYNTWAWGLWGDYAVLNSTGVVVEWDGRQFNSIYTNWHGQAYGDPQGAYQISAGTDAYGHSTVEFLVATTGFWGQPGWETPTQGDVYRYDTASGQTTLQAFDVRDLAAGQWGYDYYADLSGNVHQHDPWSNDWLIGGNVW
jgi:hypothetical protein